MKKLILAILAFSFNVALLTAQNAPQTSNDTDALRQNALNVYMSASDYIKKEITFVNYVRDLKDADVYIISTSQRTGSGGYEYVYFITGQGNYQGMSDTLRVATNPDDTQDGIRIKQVRTIKIGLARYIAKTPLAEFMNISFSQKLPQTVNTDKWDSWVFRTSVSGNIDGQKSQKSSQISGDQSASRVTENWKINLRARFSYGKDIFDISGKEYISESSSRSFNSLIVRSINDHWSYGGSTSVNYSSYSNDKLAFKFTPGIEYDLFPYSESTRRQLRFLYLIGYEHVNYSDTTIFDKIMEGHFVHSFDITYDIIQKWGSVDISLDYRNYFHDWSKNNLSLYTYVNVRITKGLSVYFNGNIALVHDQLGLVKRNVSPEEILLQRRELATKYQYYSSFGLTFTFGSIYNNVVNPRFGG